MPPLPEPIGVIGAAWDLVRSGPNFDGRDKHVIAAAKAYAQRYGETLVAAERAACISIIVDCASYVSGSAIAIEAIKARGTI